MYGVRLVPKDEHGVQTGLGVQRAGERIAASVDVLPWLHFRCSRVSGVGLELALTPELLLVIAFYF